jgi:hypothetical protein
MSGSRKRKAGEDTLGTTVDTLGTTVDLPTILDEEHKQQTIVNSPTIAKQQTILNSPTIASEGHKEEKEAEDDDNEDEEELENHLVRLSNLFPKFSPSPSKNSYTTVFLIFILYVYIKYNIMILHRMSIYY